MAQGTTDALIAAARMAFAAQGFAATSMDALAAEAGVTRGALHHHFGNKAGLLKAVLRRLDTELSVEVDAAYAGHPDPWRGFQAGFHAYLDAALRPDRRRILFQDAPGVLGMVAVDILLDSGFGALVDELRRLIADGRIAARDPEPLGHLLNGATINLAFWVAEGTPDQDRLPRAHATLQVLLDGLTAR